MMFYDRHPLCLLIVMFAFVMSGYLGERKIDRWREKHGHAPMPPGGKGRMAAYNKKFNELPLDLRREVWIFRIAGFILLGVFIGLAWVH